jgi:hypothetical protein
MRFAADENFKGEVLDALRSRIPTLDVVRVQDTEMYESDDPDLLVWLAREGRILLTHDVNTMPGYVYDRVKTGLAVPGVIIVRQTAPIGQVIDELEIMIGASSPTDFENQVKFIPIR